MLFLYRLDSFFALLGEDGLVGLTPGSGGLGTRGSRDAAEMLLRCVCIFLFLYVCTSHMHHVHMHTHTHTFVYTHAEVTRYLHMDACMRKFHQHTGSTRRNLKCCYTSMIDIRWDVLLYRNADSNPWLVIDIMWDTRCISGWPQIIK